MGGSWGSPGIPGSLVGQPFGQFAAPASTSDASAMADINRYLYLRSHPRDLIGIPSFPPIVKRNVTTELPVWQSRSERGLDPWISLEGSQAAGRSHSALRKEG